MGRTVVALVALAAIGCSSTKSIRNDTSARSAAAVVASAPPIEEPPDVVDPTAALTLPAATALALLRSPELSQFAWQIRAEEARTLQTGLRRNPEVRLLVEDVLGTGRFEGAREAQVTLELAQTIELGGKRAARIGVASATERVAAQDYEVKRVEVATEVARRFIRVLAAQEIVALADTNERLAGNTVTAVGRRVEASAESPLASSKARVELARSHIAAEHAHRELTAARRELAATWADDDPRFARVDGPLFRRAAVPDYAALTSRLESAPEIARQLSERRLREAEIRLAETRRIPDLTLQGGIRRLEGPGDESFLFGVSAPLPVSDRGQGALAEARAMVAKSEAARRSTAVRLRTFVFTAHQELLHAAMALDSLDREILPESRNALALARRGFDEGRFSYLELVDAQRTLVAVERERITTAESYHQLVLEVERVLGTSLRGDASPTVTREGSNK